MPRATFRTPGYKNISSPVSSISRDLDLVEEQRMLHPCFLSCTLHQSSLHWQKDRGLARLQDEWPLWNARLYVGGGCSVLLRLYDRKVVYQHLVRYCITALPNHRVDVERPPCFRITHCGDLLVICAKPRTTVQVTFNFVAIHYLSTVTGLCSGRYVTQGKVFCRRPHSFLANYDPCLPHNSQNSTQNMTIIALNTRLATITSDFKCPISRREPLCGRRPGWQG